MHKGLRRLIVALLVALAALTLPSPLITKALALQTDVHHLVFASDYHNTEGSIHNAMEGMPSDVEYVSLIGDLVGGGRDRAPVYQSWDILSLVQDVFPALGNTNVSLIWADHDSAVDDEGTGIVKCAGGYGSGPIYEGRNEDGSAAYYIYVVAFYEMKQGGAVSGEAAADFKTWVDGIDPTIPVIVLCHMPIQCKRGDNLGALYWNEALNYAATGVEGIVSTDATARITRNVVFLCGHNHTVSPDEFYFGAGGTMEVQVDTSTENSAYSAEALAADGTTVMTAQVEDEEFAEEDLGLQEPAAVGALDDGGSADAGTTDETPKPCPRPGREAKGVTSNIYYTSLVVGYLKTGGNATLMTIDDANVTLEKHNGGQVVALGLDGTSGAEVESPVGITQFTREHRFEHASVSVSKVDEAGAPLAGATFALRQGGGCCRNVRGRHLYALYRG
ncbi:MAG: hypothetical protein J6D34_01320 [Atopobiaceae bacterium]|nr:hypothetical protein [Atopobiaceae bacterium]